MTLNQVITQLNTIATNHNQINTFGFNDMPEYGKETSIVYPVMWVTQLPSNVNGNELNLKFRILFADLVHKGEENQDDVSSDQMQTALDVIAQLQHPDYEWFYSSISNLEPITGKLDDEISGWVIDVNLMIDNAFNRCQIPFTPSPTPENPNGFVTIYAIDGTTVQAEVSNNSYWINTQSGAGTVRVYLDGILKSTTVSNDLDAEIINILWT